MLKQAAAAGKPRSVIPAIFILDNRAEKMTASAFSRRFLAHS